MKTEDTITLRLSDFFNNSISSRDAIKKVLEFSATNISVIILDFSSIEFMTRSSTDQLLKEIKRIESSAQASVKLISVSPPVQEMIDIVSRSLQLKRKSENQAQEVIFNSSSEFQEFLFRF